MDPKILIVAAVAVVILVVLYMTGMLGGSSPSVESSSSPPPSPSPTPPPPSYRHYPNTVAGNRAIYRVPLSMRGKSHVPEMKEMCTSVPSCIGFNTSGWLYDYMTPQHVWQNIGTKDIYVKN